MIGILLLQMVPMLGGSNSSWLAGTDTLGEALGSLQHKTPQKTWPQPPLPPWGQLLQPTSM